MPSPNADGGETNIVCTINNAAMIDRINMRDMVIQAHNERGYIITLEVLHLSRKR